MRKVSHVKRRILPAHATYEASKGCHVLRFRLMSSGSALCTPHRDVPEATCQNNIIKSVHSQDIPTLFIENHLYQVYRQPPSRCDMHHVTSYSSWQGV